MLTNPSVPSAVKVFPGERNKGIFVTLPDRGGEEYQVRPSLIAFSAPTPLLIKP